MVKAVRNDVMKYFIDITLLPGPEVPLHFLWQKVYQHIHQAFVEINHNGKICIGASFPEYDEKNPVWEVNCVYSRRIKIN